MGWDGMGKCEVDVIDDHDLIASLVRGFSVV